MNNYVNDKLTSYNVVNDYVNANNADISAIDAAIQEIGILNNIMPLLVSALKTLEKDNSGLKDESDLARIKLSKTLVKYGFKASVIAEKAGKLDLAKKSTTLFRILAAFLKTPL